MEALHLTVLGTSTDLIDDFTVGLTDGFVVGFIDGFVVGFSDGFDVRLTDGFDVRLTDGLMDISSVSERTIADDFKKKE